jgi:hypothetical protein
MKGTLLTLWTQLKIAVQNLLIRRFGLQLVRLPPGHAANLRQFFGRIAPITTDHPLIRLGSETDGGYLVPDDLQGIGVCFSPGVSSCADFERDLTARGIKCFLADYSVEGPPVTGPLIVFEKKFIGTVNDSIYMTLDSWVARNASGADNNLILQMDIEGGEYEVLLSSSVALLRRFRIIVLEAHYMEQLLTATGFTLIKAVFDKLCDAGFDVVHAHPNNTMSPITYGDFVIPQVMEFSFLRRDRAMHGTPTHSFPHPLDRPNDVSKADYPLPDCWYQRLTP